MKVRELIKELDKYPDNMEVRYWDQENEWFEIVDYVELGHEVNRENTKEPFVQIS